NPGCSGSNPRRRAKERHLDGYAADETTTCAYPSYFVDDGDGIGKGATGTLFVDGKPVAEGRIPQTVAIRFSADETFDIGQDTGKPVAEDYADKMPFSFTGTLKKFVVILEPEKLTDEERKQLLAEEAQGAMAVQ
ncbi:MAG: hypothetical protein P4L90_08060, partial [Rhodopila sp.]|nr:hypothetical protein [Rhodopila sp.]